MNAHCTGASGDFYEFIGDFIMVMLFIFIASILLIATIFLSAYAPYRRRTWLVIVLFAYTIGMYFSFATDYITGLNQFWSTAIFYFPYFLMLAIAIGLAVAKKWRAFQGALIGIFVIMYITWFFFYDFHITF